MSRDLSTAEFRRWVRDCRAMFPLRHPVKVRRRPLGDCGWAQVFGDDDDASYVITINNRLDRQSTSDTLIHEWAHLITGEDTGDYETHGPDFWERHGEIYRAWHRTE